MCIVDTNCDIKRELVELFSKENLAFFSLFVFFAVFAVIVITLVYFAKGYLLAVGLTVTIVLGLGSMIVYYDYLNEKYKCFGEKEL